MPDHIISSQEFTLEGRVSKTEAALDSVQRDIGVISSDIREINASMQRLSVLVTAASGPRKTEWSTILTAAGLVMAIGASALSPMYLRMNDAQVAIRTQAERIEQHEAMPMHLVGEARMNALRDRVERIEKEGSAVTRERLAIIEAWIDEQRGQVASAAKRSGTLSGS